MKVKSQRIIFSYLVLELILLNCSFLGTYYLKYGIQDYRPQYLPLIAVFNLSWILSVLFNGSQDFYMRFSTRKRVKDLLASALMFLGIASPMVLLIEDDNFSRGMIFGTMLLFFILNMISSVLANKYINGRVGKRHFGSRLLVLGAEKNGKQVLDFTMKNRHLGYQVIGFLDDVIDNIQGANMLGKIKDLPNILDTKSVDEIVVALPSYMHEEIKYAIETADFRGVRVNLIPDFLQHVGNDGYEAYNINSMPVIELRKIPLDYFHNFITKKAFDILFSLFVLIALSPVLLAIAIAIKLTSKGPVFYKPVRKGEGGYDFTCYKFRSMITDYDPKLKNVSTMKDDPRVTSIGKFMRKYNIDEMPQFLNVLKGDMSVIGPRPHRVSLNKDMQGSVDRYMVRHYVKPGITGWAQVNGWRGPTETDEQKEERSKHDLWYIRNWSFLLDLKIVWLTVFSKKSRMNAF